MVSLTIIVLEIGDYYNIFFWYRTYTIGSILNIIINYAFGYCPATVDCSPNRVFNSFDLYGFHFIIRFMI